jgi:hypothetical protein
MITWANHSELFIDLKWQDCWRYVNAGYIVYLVRRNPTGAGHIVTGYPTEGNLTEISGKKVGKIIQAGDYERTKIFQMEAGRPWKSSDLADVKAFLYLGYLHQ